MNSLILCFFFIFLISANKIFMHHNNELFGCTVTTMCFILLALVKYYLSLLVHIFLCIFLFVFGWAALFTSRFSGNLALFLMF